MSTYTIEGRADVLAAAYASAFYLVPLTGAFTESSATSAATLFTECTEFTGAASRVAASITITNGVVAASAAVPVTAGATITGVALIKGNPAIGGSVSKVIGVHALETPRVVAAGDTAALAMSFTHTIA